MLVPLVSRDRIQCHTSCNEWCESKSACKRIVASRSLQGFQTLINSICILLGTDVELGWASTCVRSLDASEKFSDRSCDSHDVWSSAELLDLCQEQANVVQMHTFQSTCKNSPDVLRDI